MVRTDWAASVTNFRSFLPPGIERWIVAFEPHYHGRIVESLQKQLAVVEVIRLGVDSAARVSTVADSYLSDESCGFVEFAVTDASEMPREDVAALMRFARWPEERVRFCFDVADSNFALLFSDGPEALGARAASLLPALHDERQLRLRSSADETALFDCGEWTPHTGTDVADYLLPTGELECAPVNAAGTIAPNGWIVGTLPFGAKYGRIRPSSLTLELAAGRVTAIRGSDTELIRDLTLAIERIPGLEIVAELGFGISKAVVAAARRCAVGCLWHERHYGAHVGIGATLERDGRVTGHHLDFIFPTGRLETHSGRTLLAW